MWFLAGTFGERAERSCRLPTGTAVLFPLVNMIGDAESCASFMATAEGSAVLNGRTVEHDRHPGTAITFEAAEGNAVTAAAGAHTATACGLWVQLPPLDSGHHTLEIRGTAGTFSIEVDYDLTVTAPTDS